MSSLRPVGRSAATPNKDRKSLCRFTFADGRQCRIPRSPGHPHLCFDHARKDSQARAADKLARELSCFFSGEYLSACDLSTALGRLIVGVARGDVKPRSARTLAYLSQTLVQTIHLAQHEYINALGTDRWRRAVRNSVKGNYDYRFPPRPQPEQPALSALEPDLRSAPSAPPTILRGESPQPQSQPVQPPLNCHSERSEVPAFSESQAAPLQTPLAQQPTPPPHTPMPPTSAEFAQHVLAGRNTGEGRAPRVVAGLPRIVRPGSTGETGDPPVSSHVSPSANTPASPGPASVHSPARRSQATPSLPLPTARPTAPPVQSSTGAQHSPQPPSEPQPPLAAAPSAAVQEPRSAAGLQTGPSGLPVLASLPPRKPGAPARSRSS